MDLPDSLKLIGTYAFYSCEELENLYFPAQLRTIGRSAFYGCNNLTEVILAENLEKVGSYAFAWCQNLKDVYLPATLTKIPDELFGYQKPTDLILHCKEGSAAHEYAVRFGYQVKLETEETEVE